MLRKIFVLAWRELYATYSDRNLILIMIATPLVLATIIGTAFNGFLVGGGGSAPIRDIPVIVVNLDQGVQANGTTINDGTIFVDQLVPKDEAAAKDPGNVLFQLTDARQMSTVEEARSAVDKGDAVAAIIVPAEFSRKLTYTLAHTKVEPTSVEVYASPASPLSASVIRSVAESISARIASGSVTIAATIDTLRDQFRQNPILLLQFSVESLLNRFHPNFAPAFSADASPIQIARQTVAGEAVGFNPLVYFGASLALFFMMFTAQNGAQGLLEERHDGTLQRLLVTPTPRLVILLGKLAGTFINCVVQLMLLFLCLTVVGSLLSGQIQFIWGTNLASIALVMLASSLAAAGLGTLVTSLVRSPEQANVVGSVVVMVMGVAGGTFFGVDGIPFLSSLSKLTINYWGREAFTQLSQNQTDIGLNLVVLVALGAAMFAIGLFLFNRRLDE